MAREERAPAGKPGGLLQAVLDSAPCGLVGIDAGLQVVLCNRAAAELLGTNDLGDDGPASLRDFLKRSTRLDAITRTGLEKALLAASARGHAGTPPDAAQAIVLPGRNPLRLTTITTEEGIVATLLPGGADGIPSERVDGLTGLPDRQWFRERLGVMVADRRRAGPIAVLLVNLEGLAAVNGNQGPGVGDALLRMVGQRLRTVVREGDLVSRISGDEFAVAITGATAAEATGKRLVELLSRPYLVEGQIAIIGANVGVAVEAVGLDDTAALSRAAGLALFQAKRDGSRSVRVFDREMDARARARHALLDDLRRALALDQFEVHYQPQTNLATRKLVGFEALLRWRHPEHGLVPPDRFIPLAEEMDLITGIGEWVLRTACQDAMNWPDELSVAVNVSAKQLVDPRRLPRAVEAALALSGLSPRRLEVEITESALVQHEGEALQALRALRDMGVRISMDDFGTGYSSLSQLRSFPFDKLKIDRSFVRDLANDVEAVAVIRAIAALGTSLGMTTTAEGVETFEQAAMVHQDGCTDMQGYLISRPVPAGEVGRLVQQLTPVRTATLEMKP